MMYRRTLKQGLCIILTILRGRCATHMLLRTLVAFTAVATLSLADEPPLCPETRVRSYDRRVGRTRNILCTAFMIDDAGHCFITNEHCTPLHSIEFNTPLGQDAGGCIAPDLQYQYEVDTGSVQGAWGGNYDWAYFGVFPNEVTGLTPFEAMGEAFSIADHVLSPGDGRAIRVTGYGGFDDEPVLDEGCLQHTDLDSEYSLPDIYWLLQTGVAIGGGNSGSPVIEEMSGLVYGVLRQGGCDDDGLEYDWTGMGNRIDAPALKQALCRPTAVCMRGPDCNLNGAIDKCDIDPEDPDADGMVSLDCNRNGIPDECDVNPADPDGNGEVSDDCQLEWQDGYGIPDECESDCNGNDVPDECDIYTGIATDGNANGTPDSCECGLGDPCDDGLTCTSDSCDPVTRLCLHDIDPNYCVIGGVCHADGTPEPGAECMVCDVNTDQVGWTEKADGLPCTDDQLFCTGGETCWRGVCVSAGDPCIRQGLVCDEGVDACVECQSDSECDDQRECTVDACDAGVCIFTDLPFESPCGDSSYTDCDLPDICSGSGMCVRNYVSDGTECTTNGDFCDGVEMCLEGQCISPGDPCAERGLLCDAGEGVCLCTASDECGVGYACVGTECGDAGTPEEPGQCALDCNGNGWSDECDISPEGDSADENGNGVPDECDLWPCEAMRLTDPNGTLDDKFGGAVAISGDYALVGARGDDDDGLDAGAAFLYERTGTEWELLQKLEAPGITSGDSYGYSVALTDAIAVVGAPQDAGRPGVVHVFRPDSGGTGTWEYEASLTAEDGQSDDGFGSAVTVHGGYIAVGAPDCSGGDGAVYLYAEDAENLWRSDGKLSAPDDTLYGPEFGSAVSLNGSRLVVGSPSDAEPCTNPTVTCTAGSAHVFERQPLSGWGLVQKLRARTSSGEDDAQDVAGFGAALSIFNERIIIGAKNYSFGSSGFGQGAAYVFQFTDGLWQISERLVASDGSYTDYFGSSVALQDNLSFVGARGKDDAGGDAAGAVYVFEKTAEGWIEQEILIGRDVDSGDEFGCAVSIGGEHVIIGARKSDEMRGAAHLYRLAGWEDCNDNGEPDACDIGDGTSEDCNDNHVPDECDTDCNFNGVPDDCDLAEGTSADCNASDVPDECETQDNDCNDNGIPDECDLDPTDPDGNGLVSSDCQSEGLPGYGVPDECKVDCDSNGEGDVCEIIADSDLDENDDWFLDACATLYVNAEGPEGNGTEWDTPFLDLQDALDVAALAPSLITTIRVASGTYSAAPYQLVGKVTVYGGFEGTEEGFNCVLDDRDLVRNETVLTGDGTAGVVVDASGADRDSRLDGFTITGAGPSGDDGTGIRCVDCKTEIHKCIIKLNNVKYGGMYISGGEADSLIADCIFAGNVASVNGGGVTVDPGADAEFVNCAFVGNETTSSLQRGGGIYAGYAHELTVTNCTFSRNNPKDVYAISNDTATVQNSVLWGNLSGTPIAFWGYPLPTVSYSCVQGGWTATGSNNIDSEYLPFVRLPDDGGDGWGDDPATSEDESANDDYGDLQLAEGSLAIDAGNNHLVPPWVTTDLAGTRRFDDDPDIDDSGDGDGVKVDMGAYEYHAPVSAPVLPALAKHQAKKHRYISIDPSTNGTRPVALTVELVDMKRCSYDTRRVCDPDLGTCDGDGLTPCSSADDCAVGQTCELIPVATQCKNVCENNWDTTCNEDLECTHQVCSGEVDRNGNGFHDDGDMCETDQDCKACSTSGSPCLTDCDCPDGEACEPSGETCGSAGDACVSAGNCVQHPDVAAGLKWYVQEPMHLSSGCRNSDDSVNCGEVDCCTDEDWVAGLEIARSDLPGESDYRAWNSFGSVSSDLLHIGDCQIVPAAKYRVCAVYSDLSEACMDVSTAGRTTTTSYGDVVGHVDPDTMEFDPPDRIVSVGDISGYLLTNLNYGAPGDPKPQAPVTWIDMHGTGDARGRCPSSNVSCSSHEDCSLGGEVCVQRFCSVSHDPCDDDGDCPTPTCVEGACSHDGSACIEDSDCAADACGVGTCKAGVRCRTDAECEDTRCVFRTCSISGAPCSDDVLCDFQTDGICGIGVCAGTQPLCSRDQDCTGVLYCGVYWCSGGDVRCNEDSDCPADSDESCNLEGSRCVPNYILNVTDLYSILRGIEGKTYDSFAEQVSPGQCDELRALPTAPVSEPIELTLESTSLIIQPGELPEIDVYASSNVDVGAYEIALQITGGTSGNLDFYELRVDDDRLDYAFRQSEDPGAEPVQAIEAPNKTGGRLGNALQTGDVFVQPDSAYLTTYVLAPSDGAYGVFAVSLKGDGASFVTDRKGRELPSEVGAAQVLVGVGIDCFEDSDCAPVECKTATCTNYECIYTNLPESTSCDDGMFCTKTDECDANGNCIGSGAKCPMFQPTCCELGDYCTCSTCQCAAQ